MSSNAPPYQACRSDAGVPFGEIEAAMRAPGSINARIIDLGYSAICSVSFVVLPLGEVRVSRSAS